MDIVFWAPFIDLSQSNLVNSLLNSLLSRLKTFLLILLLGFSHDEAYLWQDNCQL